MSHQSTGIIALVGSYAMSLPITPPLRVLDLDLTDLAEEYPSTPTERHDMSWRLLAQSNLTGSVACAGFARCDRVSLRSAL
jgi:hypothetical protein